MRDDVLVEEVLAKCDVFKKAGLWPSEPTIRPRAWLSNFDQEDVGIAAFLLDKFTFYNQKFSDALLVSSYHSIGDGLEKGPEAPNAFELIQALGTGVITPVTGERPNPTDSGYLMCRKARQLLNIPEKLVVGTEQALDHASKKNTVIFIDDFIGSGDQFITTWNRKYGRSNPHSFSDIQRDIGFNAIYITCVATDFGLKKINDEAPKVAVCASHVLNNNSTLFGISPLALEKVFAIRRFLIKYSYRLTPNEDYIANNLIYRAFGYKKRALFLGFEHSIPDATLPIFWSPGKDNWEPLIERN